MKKLNWTANILYCNVYKFYQVYSLSLFDLNTVSLKNVIRWSLHNLGWFSIRIASTICIFNTVMFALCKNKNIHCYFMMQWILSSTPVPVTKNSNFCCFAHSSKQQNQLSLKLDGILVWFCILNLQLYDRKPIFQSTYIPLLLCFF